jgi:hypothetical protein
MKEPHIGAPRPSLLSSLLPKKLTAKRPLPFSKSWALAKKNLLQERELSLFLGEFWQRRFAEKNLFGSKVSNPGSKSNALLDREILRQMHEKTKKGATLVLTARQVRPVVRDRTNRKNKISKKTIGSLQSQNLLAHAASRKFKKVHPSQTLYRIQMPHWDHTSPILKCLAYGAAIPVDERCAFSLNLTPAVQEAGVRAKKGIVGYLQDRISRELRSIEGLQRQPDFYFALEGDAQLEPFHLHGAIAMPGDCPFDPAFRHMHEDWQLIERALRRAGGDEKAPRLLSVKGAYDIVGWTAYLSKSRWITLEALTRQQSRLGLAIPSGDSIVGATLSLRRAGRQWFENARRSEEPALWSSPNLKCVGDLD